MSGSASGSLQREGVEAFIHMEKALRLLDTCEEATGVGAQLDLAICRLEETLSRAGVKAPPRESGLDAY